MRHEHCSQTNNITTADTPPSKKTIMADPLLKIKANDWIKSVITIRDNIKRFEKKEAEAFICAVRAVLEIDTVGKQMAEADLNGDSATIFMRPCRMISAQPCRSL